jgi:hypothetical protein
MLARHSIITLTMDRYTHSFRGDESAALTVLPDLLAAACQQARATDTDGGNTDTEHMAFCLAQDSQRGSILVGADRRGAGKSNEEKTPNPRGKTGSSSGGEGIRTPDTLTGIPVFKTGAFDHSATPPVAEV